MDHNSVNQSDNSNSKQHQSDSAQTNQLDVFLKFRQGSTLHKIAWSVIGIGVCVGFVLHLMTLIERYSTYPVNTEFEEKLNSYEFPDVTLCPTNFGNENYGKKFIPSPTGVPNGDRGIHDIIYDATRFIHLLRNGNTNDTVPANPYSSYRDAKLSLRKIAYRTKQFPEAHDIVIFCRFNSKKCTFRNFTNQNDEEHFKCITFTPLNRTVTRAVKGSGLTIMFFIRNDIFLTNEDEIDYIDGLQVILHEPGQKPNPQGVTSMAPLKFNTEIMIDTKIDDKINRNSYNCVQSLPNVTYVTDFSQINQSVTTQSFIGSEHDCRIRIMQNQFLNDCSCLATHLPLPADLYDISDGVCHHLDEHFMFRDIFYTTVSSAYTYYTIRNDSKDWYTLRDYINENWNSYNSSWQKIDCYHKVLQQQESDGVNTESCPVLCKRTKYKMTSRRVTWPRSTSAAQKALPEIFQSALSDAQSENLTLDDLTWLNSNPNTAISSFIGVLDLHPRELSVAVSKEDWAYPLRNFFSDLGGILGLWIGASIFSLMEFIEFSIEAVHWIHVKIKSNLIKPSTETGNDDEDDCDSGVSDGVQTRNNEKEDNSDENRIYLVDL